MYITKLDLLSLYKSWHKKKAKEKALVTQYMATAMFGC